MTDLTSLKAGLDLAGLIEQQHELQPGNKRYRRGKAHDSLVVDTQKQVYYWFSQSERGDAIDWIGRHCLQYNGQWNATDPTLFKEAVSWLAKHTGQPEPAFKPEAPAARAERLSRERLMELAAGYYRQAMGREVQGWQYALERGFSPETVAGLGYADGGLWRAIAEADRALAAEMGLIGVDGRRVWDAIPAGCLVYVHQHRGRVEYLTGRAIAEKRHMNQRAPKKMFWAEAGFGPLVIVEGQADALSIKQLGVSSLALCGVNLSDFDPDWLHLYGPIYIWQDNDEPGSLAAQAWAKRLADLVAALGPLVRVVISPDGVKDANDYLKGGAAAADMQTLLAGAVTWLDTEIGRIAALKGADMYDALQPLFGHLAGMDIFQLNIYRSKICKELNISQGDFGRYLKAAKGTLSDDEESEFAKGGQYTEIDGWLVLKHFTDDGKPKISPLANGTAKILEEVLRDDGSNEPTLEYIIGGELHGGQSLPKISIPAAEYGGLKWLSQWGSRFILTAGRSTADNFRAAVQFRSGAPHRRLIYTHTGWRKAGDKMMFLTAAGALGGSADIQVDLRMGRQETNMARYHLPAEPENVAGAMLASLNYWLIADPAITIPIWAAMYLSPLMPFLVADFGLWVHGQTGSMKSSLVAAALAHWGHWQGKDAKVWLPSNFQSTSNNILMNAFQAKDVPLVIDDFAPGATTKEVRERDATASNLLRSVGNKAARGRMRDGRTFQADFPPRCLAVITAEDLPSTASIMARGVGVRVHLPGKGDPARKLIEQRLSRAQTVDSYLYPHAMSGFVQWVQRHWEQLERDLPVMAAGYRDRIQAGGHARLPDAFGKLMSAIDTALFFATDVGALTDNQAQERKRQAFEAMGIILAEHGEAVDSVDACKIFHEILTEHLDARLWYLCPTAADSVGPPDSYPHNSALVGYVDEKFIYLLTKTVSDAMTHYQKLGSPFPVGRNTLFRRLAERGWLVSSSGKSTETVYIPALNTSPRVMKLRKDVFL